MSGKTLFAAGALATVAVVGFIASEAMKTDSDKARSGKVNADFRIADDQHKDKPEQVSDPIEDVVSGTSVFLKRPTLNMSKAVSKGTLTSAKKLKRDRERAKQARKNLERGFAGTWRGLSPFAVNESIIAHADIKVHNNNATGKVWVVTEFKDDGVQCRIVPLKDARVLGNQLSFRADGKAGSLTLGPHGNVVKGSLAGRKASLARVPE